jgi:hypothetical protein
MFPDDASSRALAFMLLCMFSVAHVLSKGFGVALFWATFGGNAVCVYYGAEIVIFFMVKAIRSDLIYWYAHKTHSHTHHTHTNKR